MEKSPIKAIRSKCLDCTSGSTKTIKYCTICNCPLWSYRFGIRPKTAKNKHGKELMLPEKIPDSKIPLKDLP